MAETHPGNVVQIHEHTGFTRRFTPAGAARLLHACKDLALERLAGAVARALDQVDDALFALADKAGSDVLQSHYFDAMRELRLKRQDVETAFKREFIAAAEALIAGATPAEPAPTLAEAGLSLVEHDDLEESLAINTLVDKLEALCHDQLFPLRERVGLLLDREHFAAGDLHVGPRTLCLAFKAACAGIESGVDIKIIVFKLFDRYVCEAIRPVYHELNEHLAGNGVLPRIAARVRNGQQSRTLDDQGHAMGSHNSPDTAEPDFLAAFSQLLAAAAPRPGGAPATGRFCTSGEGAARLLQDLTLLQQGQWETLGDAVDPATLAGGTANVVRIIKDNATAGEQGNGMVMEVVALLFDYIFDNDAIPDRAKTLIGRLQIPVLKVAMLDASFFSKRHHPARRLLNTLAHAARGLHDRNTESALYRALEDCVQQVQVEFDTDIAVFETALNGLEGYLENHEDKLSANVEEAKKLMQGRERLKIAEALAETEIERRLAGRDYPEFIKAFALSKWKDLLLVAYLKEGRESEAWQTRLELLDLLIWSTLPKSNLKDKKQLVDMLPTLLDGIETGMKLLSVDDKERAAFLEQLACCHARVVNAERGVAPAPAASGLKVSYLPGDSESAAARPGKADALANAPATKRVDGMLVEEMMPLDIGAPGDGDEEQDGAPRLLANIDPFGMGTTKASATADAYAELVGSLVPGVWLEFHHDGRKRVERLSWISTVLGSYLFTDSEGLKSRELKARELEDALRDGRASVADDMSLLVDRSLNALLDDLQKKTAG